MITVKIELWPLGFEDGAREIGRMYIANDGRASSNNPQRGDYQVAVCRRGTDEVPRPVHPDGPEPTRAGEVHDYPRLAYNVWRLIARACLAAFPEERTPKGTKTVIDADVMRGLRTIAQFAQDTGLNCATPEAREAVAAAYRWLAEDVPPGAIVLNQELLDQAAKLCGVDQ